MRIHLDAKVRTKDGHGAGHVRRAVWAPATNEISAFVVSTGGLLGHDVVVSREILEHAGREGDALVIDMTKDELDSLDRYEEHAYAPPPYGWLAPATYTYPSAAYVFPVDVPATLPIETAPATARHAIKRGMPVKDVMGDTIGRVEDLRLDDMTGELRAILVRPDGAANDEALLEIPADHIDVGEKGVQLIEVARGETKRG